VGATFTNDSGETTPRRAAIVVTCFNDGATLDETIVSIGPELADVELVVVDDGSTDDDTLRLLSRLEQDGVRVIRQDNQGPSAAAMTGLGATSAPYVMRLDADDLLEPRAIAALVDALESKPEAAAAWGDFETFGLTTFRVPTAPALDAWLLTYVNCVPGAACLFRRTALVDVGGWQLREGHEDWDLWMSLAERGYPGAYVPRVVFHYRRDEGGRMAASVADGHRPYAELRRRHEALFAERKRNRRRSEAPLALKIAVSLVEALPGVPRLTKIHLCELFTHLFWNGGVRMTAPMAWQAIGLRLRRRRVSRRG
jgi:glycosyltransferase involved in cell wall biosynthesis